MKINLFIRSFTFLLAIYISFYIISSIINDNILCAISCEGFQSSTLDNQFWKIEQFGSNTWKVLFRNVGIQYEVLRSQENTDVKTNLYTFKQIGANNSEAQSETFNNNAKDQAYVSNGSKLLKNSTESNLHQTAKHHNNIVDAVMEHFNNIQRGKFHSDAENMINPNSHGQNTAGSSKFKHFELKSSNSSLADKGELKNNNSSLGDKGESKDTSKDHTWIVLDIRSPLDQFSIRDLFIIIIPFLANLYISYTNIALYLTIAMLVIITINILATNYDKIQTSSWYIAIESVYATLYSIVINQINTTKGQSFFPFIYCLFVFILTNNLIGMVPYSFAPTSHFILTFFISFTIVFGSTILGFILHKLKFFSLLVPNGCPLGLLPLLVLIESISYLARNVSLGLRLAANILSGHMLLNILSEFTYKIMDTNIIYFFIGIIPLAFIGAFSTLELGIAFIQAQVFVVLSSSYIKDSLELH